jgi:hypothetical protein
MRIRVGHIGFLAVGLFLGLIAGNVIHGAPRTPALADENVGDLLPFHIKCTPNYCPPVAFPSGVIPDKYNAKTRKNLNIFNGLSNMSVNGDNGDGNGDLADGGQLSVKYADGPQPGEYSVTIPEQPQETGVVRYKQTIYFNKKHPELTKLYTCVWTSSGSKPDWYAPCSRDSSSQARRSK